MGIIELCFLGAALAMDCFTVSIVCGVMLRERVLRLMVQIALLFGFFQALMPLIGWFCTSHFQEQLEAYDHWIAFSMLGFIGGKMIYESFQEEEEQAMNPRCLKTQLMLAVATSIDALAVGISFACTGFNTFSALLLPLFIIGIFSFGFSLAGHVLGLKFGNAIAKRFKPELIGGLVLLFIGSKVLWEHLMG